MIRKDKIQTYEEPIKKEEKKRHKKLPLQQTMHTWEPPAQQAAYYTPKRFGEKSKEMEGSIRKSQLRLMDLSLQAKKQEEEYQNAAKVATSFVTALSKLQQSYMDNPNENTAAQYQALRQQAQEVLSAYSKIETAYYGARKNYEVETGELNAEIAGYLDYAAQEQREYDQWKATVRRPDDIYGEISQVDELIGQEEKRQPDWQRDREMEWTGELLGLEQKMEELERQMNSGSLPPAQQAALDERYNALVRQYEALKSQGPVTGESNELTDLRERKKLLEEEKEWSDYFYYADLINAENFEEYSKSVKPTMINLWTGKTSETGSNFGMRVPENGTDEQKRMYDAVNKGAGSVMSTGAGQGTVQERSAREATEEETEIFNYLYQSPEHGPEEAMKYAQYMMPVWAERAGEYLAEATNYFGVREIVGLMSGLEQAAKGTKQWFFAEPVAQDVNDYWLNKLQEKNQSGVGKYTLGASVSIGQMIPAIGVSAVGGPVAGAATTAITSGGATARQDMLEGNDSASSKMHGAMSGIAEAGLSYLLGGISALGGKATGVTKNVILGKIKNSLGKAAANLAVSMGGEILEEEIQLFLDPAFAMLAGTAESYESPEWQDALDVMIETALTVGVMEAGTTKSVYSVSKFTKNNVVPCIESLLKLKGIDPEAYEAGVELQQIMKENGGLVTPEQYAAVIMKYGMKADMRLEVEGDGSSEEAGGANLSPTTGEALDGANAASGVQQGSLTQSPTVTDPLAQGSLGTEQQGVETKNATGPQVQQVEGNIQTGGTADEQGNYISDGGQGRIFGTGTSEQNGIVAKSTGTAKKSTQQFRKASERQNRVNALRAEKVSAKKIGIWEGTDNEVLQIAPEETWDEEQRSVAEKIKKETGLDVTFVIGGIQIDTPDGVRLARGAYNENGIVIQADNIRMGIAEIADHEIFHDKTRRTIGLTKDIETRILERFDKEEFSKTVDIYIEKLQGIIDIPENATPDEIDAATDAILEEIFADAYAGINAFSANAPKYTQAVEEVLTERGAGRNSEAAEAIGRTNEQNQGKFSAERKKKTKGQLRQEEIQRKKDAGEWTFADEVNEQLESQIRTDDNEEAGYSYENRSLTEDEEVYSYDFLTEQEDMKVVELPEIESIRGKDGKVDREAVVQKGMENARAVGMEKGGKILVDNHYTGRQLQVTNESIRHGLSGDIYRLLTNARIGAVAGELIQNAIPINALKQSAINASGTYAMAVYARGADGREVVAIITVEEYGDNVTKMEVYDLTHAISGREKRGKQVDTFKSSGNYPSMVASEISISDLLEAVKSTYQSILSVDVLSHLGETRNARGYYADRVLFSAEEQEAEYEAAVQSGDMEAAQRMVDEAAKKNGYIPAVRYHQTDKKFTEFRTDQPKAGRNDSETPNGIFFKTDDRNIGLDGDIQMEAYLKTENTLYFGGRKAANAWYQENIDGYRALQEKMQGAIVPITEEMDALEDQMFGDISQELYDELDGQWKVLMDKLKTVEDGYRMQLRDMLDDYFLTGRSGYDSIELAYDGHRWVNGEKVTVHTIIVFSPEQVKSSAPVTYDDEGNLITLSERFNEEKTDIRFSVDEDFAEDIDRWDDEGRPEAEEFVLGSTGDVLQGLGAIESDIYMLGDKINTIMDEHPEMTLDEIKRIPEILDDPVLILKSRGNNGKKNSRLVIFGTVIAQNGQPVLSVLDLRPREQGFLIDDMQKVNSAYTRNNPVAFVENSEVLYADKKRTIPLLRKFGLAITSRQLLRYGSVGNITYEGNNVKLSGVKFSDITQETEKSYLSTDDAEAESRDLHRPEGMSDEEYEKLNERWHESTEAYGEARAAAAKAESMRSISKENFRGTDALKKLGVKIENSVGIYQFIESLIANDKAAKRIQKELKRAEKRLNATEAEKDFASGIAAGIYTEEDIPKSMNADTVLELADFYWAEKAVAADMIRQQRADINNALSGKMEELFRDSDKFKPSRAIVLNERTPERNMLHIFGDKRGAAINEEIFDPVQTNEAERYRFVNRMYDDVRTFEDSQGKQRRLSKTERALVQQVIEGKAVGEIVAGMEMRTAIQNAAENIQNGKDVEDAVREFGLGQEERKLAVKYSRWIQTQQELKSGKVDIVKVDNAVKKYTEKFNQFYAAINDFLVAHGYEPIGFIKGYAPHLQPEDNQKLFNKALKAMGINTDVSKLPASISGLTGNYKPNKKWNPYFLQRTGDITEYDIASAYESYVSYMSDVLYHTDDIMRVRQAANYFRRTYAPDEIHAKLEWAEELRYLSADKKANFLRENGVISRTSVLSAKDIDRTMDEYISELYGNIENTTKYSEFVSYLDNYANILAGKQSMADRGWEYSGGRTALNIGNKLTRAFARAQVAGNISSALNQISQLPQIRAELGLRYTGAAIRDIVSGKTRKAAWAEHSDFLVGKKGIDYIVTTKGEMIISGAFMPAQLVDGLVSTIAVRGKYLKEIKAGKSSIEAMKSADQFAKSIMASRMKGSRPLAYEAKGPVSQMLHIFQPEVVNQWEHLFQDLPREFRSIAEEKGKAVAARALALVIVKMLISAFALNRLVEELYGGTPVPFDILGLSANFIASGEGLTTNEWLRTVIDNGLEKITGKRLFDTEEESLSGEFDWNAALEDTAYNVGNDIPFLRNGMSLLGLGDETLPMPDIWGSVGEIKDAIQTEGVFSGETGKALFEFVAEFVPGGRQLLKTAQGLEAAARGGYYKGYGDDRRLQYPVEGDAWDYIQGGLFGRSAMQESKEFWASGNSGLTVKETEVYREATKIGADESEVYKTISEMKKVKKTEVATEDEQKITILQEADLSPEAKNAIYFGLLASEKEQETMTALDEAGADAGAVLNVLIGVKDAADYTGATASNMKRTSILNSELEDAQKRLLYNFVFGDKQEDGSYLSSRDEDIASFADAGMGMDDFLQAQSAYTTIGEEYDDAGIKAAAFSRWIEEQDFSSEQKAVIKESFGYYRMNRASSEKFDEAVEAGLDTDEAYEWQEALGQLKPEEGKSSVQDHQKWRASVDFFFNDVDDQLTALRIVMTDTQFARVTVANAYGVDPNTFVLLYEIRDRYDENENGNWSNDEYKKAIDNLLGQHSREEKAVLWQLATGSTSAKNNPYSRSVGQKVLDAYKEEKKKYEK